MDFVRLERHEDGVLFAFIDNPRDRVNTLVRTGHLRDSKPCSTKRRTDHFAKALVFISGKKDNFIAGADIRDFDKISEPGHAKEIITRVHALFNRISNLHYPSIAAINGACLGGGFELALACHFRIATDSDKTVLGLPEVKLGILPAAGGTQRLTRTAGIKRALPLMLTGKSLSARRGKISAPSRYPGLSGWPAGYGKKVRAVSAEKIPEKGFLPGRVFAGLAAKDRPPGPKTLFRRGPQAGCKTKR